MDKNKTDKKKVDEFCSKCIHRYMSADDRCCFECSHNPIKEFRGYISKLELKAKQ